MAYDESDRPSRTYGNHGPGAVLNTISLLGIVAGFLLILNRLFWRWKKGTPGIDDLIIVFAWLALFVLGIVTYLAVNYGYGRKAITLTETEASHAIQMFYLYQIFYKITLNASKLSILTLYLRVFDTKDWFGKTTKCLIFLVVTYTFSITMANVFICSPIQLYWQVPASHVKGNCINVLGYWYASSLYNIFSECLMLLTVLIRIWTLPSHSQPPILQFRQKINLTIVLGLGVFTVITAILRVTTLNQAAQQQDKTAGTLVSTIWSSVEACLALCIANLPMLRQLLRWRGWCGGRWFSSTAGKSRNEASRRQSEHGPANEMQSRRRDREIHMQTDFEREVIEDEESTVGIGSSGLKHVEFQSGPSSSRLSDSVSKTSLKGGSDRKSSKSPSIASTLRSPVLAAVEPLPMVRISTEPSTTSLQSVFVQSIAPAHLSEKEQDRSRSSLISNHN